MYAMVAPPDNDVLWARALHVTHNGSPALTGVSLGVREGEILAVNGPRGSGKTTLLQCLSGQLLPQKGEVWFNSTPVHTMGPLVRERLRRDRFGWIDPEPHLVPELTAWENVALPLMLRGASHRVSKPAAQEWLDRLDIGGCARKRPHALLQSERQRVAIARALVTTPSVLFADEPTAPLHRADHTLALRTLTTAARSHGITVVLATNDQAVAMLADRTVNLLDGRRVSTVHLPGADGSEAGEGAMPEKSDTTEPPGVADPADTTGATSATGDTTPTGTTITTSTTTTTSTTAGASRSAGVTAPVRTEGAACSLSV
ncbi:ATP-binding cassette domain-containing protein [Streptomyces sp. SID335]|uniref:ABC transporter ATP-binding protein n=1 Tax=Streptomyces venezuelae TaxID=54571 RepID=A0A5P2BJ44_STRVZ|nr:ATP-binding cassette domain-containing protein [Streptomyces sp. SID335]MYZ17880.1 ATP-binding cassette domain-containing protein [Streptomyces sp. SID337]NDZ86492.1 ATP-binding cassette domain-containing protein [Streptomyces sp. SID10115]NEA05240.1 ATP-binding cassette domain-containing protein [Streptomyces sp. SID10116]NEB45897.1 ATP-binding cassette domain-containing protein [Streptomyces sp. SID339]QES29758.1 ABC transporter ATP-binding protein [Streptomyces venezuelae]